MSSLAATKADGYYYPPGYDPQKHGSLNKFQGSRGALGSRARKLDEGILVIRFELPVDSWCLGCGAHIARGTRYNAERKKAGKYLSTPIWEFHMTCRLCSHPFVIRTDPEHRDYAFVSGLRKKVEDYAPAAIGAIGLKDDATTKALVVDPLFKLEYGEEDKRRALGRDEALLRLQALRDRDRDAAALNAAARATHRAGRHAARDALERGRKVGLPVPLSEPTEAERSAASDAHFLASFERTTPASLLRATPRR